VSAEVVRGAQLRVQRSSGVVLAHTARKAVRSGVLWGCIFGILIASSAISYTRIYKTPAQRAHLAAAFGSNNATSALFGPASQLGTVGGFTVFKSFMALMVLGAIWGLLAATRVLRGEEDAGRWELLLTGQTTSRGATAQALGGLAGGVGALWAVTAVSSVAAGRYPKVNIAPGPACYLALAAVASAAMFVAVGALTSQLAATRRQAAAYAGWFLGACYALQMIADAGVGLHGLVWVSPLGWVEELRPLTDPRPLALLPIAGFSAVVAVVALYLAGRRDLGAATLADRARGRPRLGLLFGQVGLGIRLVGSTVIGWVCALAITGMVLGLIARSAGASVSGSSVKAVFSRLGAPGAGAKAFLGVSFLVVAVLVAFVAAGQIGAARSEDAEGRLDHLLVRPVARLSWLAGRTAIAAAVLVVGALVAGAATWLGAASQGAAVSFTALVAAAVNVVPPALCLLGVGVLALGVWPRAASHVVYAVLGWSLFVEVAGAAATTSHWLADTSLFHQMAAAPAVSPNWAASTAMIGIGVMCAAVGAAAFRLRDIRGE
jgi:ABC-2 type transport system permease protein